MTTHETPSVKLFDGTPVPILGLGTWKSESGEVGNAVRSALEVGYRHIDCARIYQNEAEVGQALSSAIDSGVVKRDDLWVTSKLWNDSHAKKDVAEALKRTLDDLRLDRLDLYLMHWPVAFRPGVGFPRKAEDYAQLSEVPLEETWEALLECRQKGMVRHVGVSNFSASKVRRLRDAFDQPVAMNQVELHPYLQQSELLRECERLDTRVTAYSPLGTPDSASMFGRNDEQPLLKHPTVSAVAERRGATPGQVLIAWGLHRGTCVIPKTTKPKRLQENFEALQVRLDNGDMKGLAELDRHHRLIDGSFFCGENSPYTLKELWDEAA